MFLDRHGPGTMARRWFYLAENMACRIGDMNSIGPKNILLEDGYAFLAWQPKKKGSQAVKVPVMPELAEELAASTFHDDAFLTISSGRPFASSGSLDNQVRSWIIQAGLCKVVEEKNPKTMKMEKVKKATRSQHGLRKAVALELAHAGGTVYEIMARLSHSDMKTSEVYAKGIHRATLAVSGYERVQDARKNKESVPTRENRGTLGITKLNNTRVLEEKWQPVGEFEPLFPG